MSGTFSDTELRARHHATHVAFNRAIPAGAASSRLEEPAPGVIATVVPVRPQRSLFNAVLYDEPAAVIGALDAIAAMYDEAGIGAWTVWTDPVHEELCRALLEAGHALDGTPERMAGVLSEMDLEPRTDARIDVGTWDEVGECNDVAYEMGEATFGAPLRDAGPELRRYVARDESGRAVASAVAVHHAGDCGIELVATRAEARGRGLASDLMRAALRDARDAGCATTSLEATRMGAPVYERIGYRRLGPIHMYERRWD